MLLLCIYRSVVERPVIVERRKSKSTEGTATATTAEGAGVVGAAGAAAAVTDYFESQLSVIVQTHANGAKMLRVTAAPVDIFWNNSTIEKLLAFFMAFSSVDSLVLDPKLVIGIIIIYI